MAFGNSVSVCEYCFFGSSCNASHVAGITVATNISQRCVCAPGYVHDVVFFHDPTCSMPDVAIQAWFIVMTVLTFILSMILFQTDPKFTEWSGIWRDTCRAVLLHSAHSSDQNNVSPIGAPFTRGLSTARRSMDSGERHKDQLRKLMLTVVVFSWMYALAAFTEGRAGVFANIVFGMLFLSLAFYMYIAVLYVLKPLFRILGKSQFDRMRKMIRNMLLVWAAFFISTTIILVSRNDSEDVNDPRKEAVRIAYNRIASFEALLNIIFALLFGLVLSSNITQLMSRLSSTQSFRNGDVMILMNYGRLQNARRQTWLISMDIILALPWVLLQWVLGLAPYFWVFFMLSFVMGPSLLTWFQYTLTKSSSPTEQAYSQPHQGQRFHQECPLPSTALSELQQRPPQVGFGQSSVPPGDRNGDALIGDDQGCCHGYDDPCSNRCIYSSALSVPHETAPSNDNDNDEEEDKRALATVVEGNDDEESHAAAQVFSSPASYSPSRSRMIRGVTPSSRNPNSTDNDQLTLV